MDLEYQRGKWEYKHLENLDLSIFYLNEKPLGEYNKKQLKLYNFNTKQN